MYEEFPWLEYAGCQTDGRLVGIYKGIWEYFMGFDKFYRGGRY